MNPDELLRLLDLDAPDPLPPSAAGAVATDTPPDPAASPTALGLDDWSLRRGDELLADTPELRALDVDPFAAADFLAAAFLPDPVLATACRDPLRHRFVAALLETPDYRTVHEATLLCEPAAAVAAVAFAAQFAALRDDPSASRPHDPVGQDIAAIRAATAAAAEAESEVRRLGDAVAGLGLGPGEPGSLDPRAVAEACRRVRADVTLRRICERAGRFRRVAQSRQRRKASHGIDEVVGVVPGDDVARLLATELARLADPDFERDALRRLSEKACFCRELRTVEPVGRGPVIVVVDESGSMQGDKVETAKGLALAVAWVARKQRRWVGLVAYSGDSGERLLALPPGRWDEAALADWAAAFLGRGSTLDVPVRELPAYYRRLGAPAGTTDVLIVTDARCHIPADLRDAFLAWKKSVTATVVSLVVGAEPGDLAAISDEAHSVAVLSADADPVGRALDL